MVIFMNILIIGCGKIGSRLAQVLSEKGHDISIIDSEPSKFDFLPNDFNGFTTTGVPIDQDVLKKAGIESCDVVAAVTSNDNINIMVSELATEIFKVPKVFVRIYDPRRDEVFSNFGMATVCPTNLTVSAICSALEDKTAQLGSMHIGVRTVNFTTMEIPKSFIGLKASEIEFEKDEILYAVLSENNRLNLVGFQDIILHKGDTLIFSKIAD